MIPTSCPMKIPPCVEADVEHDIGYIHCNQHDEHSDGVVARTVSFEHIVNLDFNEKGELVGVELLTLRPFEGE